MGASSVTGVGQGSADKAGQKGSEHLYVGVEKLIGTRIVMSGVAYIASGTSVTVKLPQNLPGNWSSTYLTQEDSPADSVPPTASDYAIFLTGVNTGSNVLTVSAITTTSNVQNFTITSSSSLTTKHIAWQIVRLTNATVTGFPTHN